MAVETTTTEDDTSAPTSVAITIQLAVLAVAFVVGRFLERIRFQWMGEAGAALLLGLGVGLVLKAAGVGAELAAAVAFKGNIFFYVLLPIIMFDAGYSLDTRMFIRNLGSLCLYAFAGTTISCFVIGLMMWAFGEWGWCLRMPLLANLTFGALVSATDPVTVLAVFQRLDAQPDLYMNVFGESVLNDAVGMVLYNVLASFLDGKEVTTGSVFAGIGMFVGIFLGSAVIGIAMGLLAAFIFKSRYFYSGPIVIHNGADSGSTGTAEAHSGANSSFEVGLAVVFAYGSYLVADVAHCSGIVAVVVNGMVMNMYVRPNLSEAAAHKIETLFKTLAGLFELFVFCYIGTTMFLDDEQFNIVDYTALSLLALAVSRAANILPLTALVNLLRPLERRTPPAAQFMLWWAGLRGAMAFALSVEADERFGAYGKVMKTCTFYLIFITVLFNGGTSAFLLRRLKLRAQDTPALLRQYDTHHQPHRDVAGLALGSCSDGDGDDPAEARGGDGGEPKRRGRRRGELGPEGQPLQGPCGGGGSEDGRSRGGGGVEGGEEDEEDGGGGGDRLVELQAGAKPASRSLSWFRSETASFSSSGRGGGAPRSGSSLPRAPPSALLERVRSLNDGRLVDKFDAFDRKVSKLLIHPDALREAEVTSHSSFRAGLAATQQGGLGAVSGSHAAPQTLSPSPSKTTLALNPEAAVAAAAALPAGGEVSVFAPEGGLTRGSVAGSFAQSSQSRPSVPAAFLAGVGSSLSSYNNAAAATAAASGTASGTYAAAAAPGSPGSLGLLSLRPLTGLGSGSEGSGHGRGSRTGGGGPGLPPPAPALAAAPPEARGA